MNPQRTFARKVAYVVAIGLLLIPLFLLARPTSTGRPGGKLSQLREKQGLSEAQIGEIDPTSEAMKLSTFGMRGVATALLWHKSMEYQKKKDWTGLAATLNQIIRLEPHFISVWKFQSWNMAYNVSAEFDDYRERYRWVIKGIEFLIQGVGYNDRNPVLYAQVGWDTAQKIGTADEKVQFRKLFKADDEFHNKYRTPSYEERDNWLVGKSWYEKAEKLVSEGESIGKMGENIFYARRPKCQIEFARNIEKDGQYFGEKAGENWALGHKEWTEEFGAMPIRTTYRDDNDEIIKIVLNDYDGLNEESVVLQKELENMEEGLYDRLMKERWEKLDPADRDCWRYYATVDPIPEIDWLVRRLDKIEPDWRSTSVDLVRDQITKQQAAALEVPRALRTTRDMDLVEQAMRTIGERSYRAIEALTITMQDLAREIKGDSAKRREAFKLVERADEIKRQQRIVGSYRQTVNFDEWEFRSTYEQYPETLEAREYVFKGRQALADGLLPEAQDYFRRGLAAWGVVLGREDCQRLADDRDTVEDLAEVVDSYVDLLEQRDELFPEEFPLASFYAKIASKSEEGGVSKAREASAYAAEALANGETQKAIDAYQSAMESWDQALRKYRALALMIDRGIGGEVMSTVENFASALEKGGKAIPVDYGLSTFFHLHVSHSPECVEARKLAAQAAFQANKSKYPEAQKLFEDSMQQWRALLDRYPSILLGTDPIVSQQISETIGAYKKVLELRDKELPKDFPLKDFVEKTEKKA